jgi:hypothetical protein
VDNKVIKNIANGNTAHRCALAAFIGNMAAFRRSAADIGGAS